MKMLKRINECFFVLLVFFFQETTSMTLQDLQDDFVNHLFVWDAKDLNENAITLERIGKENDGGYVVPTFACSTADVCLGYGIADDPSFEIMFSDKFNKPSFGFDGGTEKLTQTHPLFTFIPECIGTEEFLYPGQVSSGRVSSFEEQIEKLNLTRSQIFIKMDIEGAELEVLPSILLRSSQITGFVIEFHDLWNFEKIQKTINIVKMIESCFLLMHVHNNNYAAGGFKSQFAKGEISPVIELTFLNKSLVSSFEKSKNQIFPKEIDMKNCPDRDDVFFELLN